ncbi:peptidase MA family metallohydrolase [Candidatus Poribacteria bacterium]
MIRCKNRLSLGARTSCPQIKLLICLLLLGFIFSTRAAEWSAIESEHFDVIHNESENAAREILKLSESFYPRVTTDIGYKPERKIRIWFCRTQREFNMAVAAPIQDWAAGAAYPLRARIVVRDPAYVKDRRINLERLVKHEITHVVFGLYLSKNIKNVPRWFSEGLAMYEAGEWSYAQYWTMLTASLGNSIIPFYELAEDFPWSEGQARMAYAQSCSIVTFIAKRYGEDALRQCIALLAEGRGIDEALAGSTGWGLVGLERRWLKSIKGRYKWISFIGSWVVLWSVAVLILVAAYWRRKVKNRRIIQQWEEEEEWWWEFDDDEETYE